ncbi:hypothetical protein BJX63DRAFT_396565 [Aspergillus granulosus]|uniref:Uncharacterized protein n=1 Tax=Aspergillus granulosus TaxID=176169 RepID=A0ABR4HAM2_9EURO
MTLSRPWMPAVRIPTTQGEAEASDPPDVRSGVLEGQMTEIPRTLPMKKTRRRQRKWRVTLGMFLLGDLISPAVPTTISGVKVKGSALLIIVAIAAMRRPSAPGRIRVFVAPGSFQ